MEILLVLQVIVVIALIAVILVQKSSSDGFTGGSSPNSFLTGRASANLFTRITSILATIFIVNSLVLAYIASHTDRAGTILEQAADEAKKENIGKDKKDAKGSLSEIEQKMKNLKSEKTDKPAAEPAKEDKSEKSADKPDTQKPAEQKPASAPGVPVSE